MGHCPMPSGDEGQSHIGIGSDFTGDSSQGTVPHRGHTAKSMLGGDRGTQGHAVFKSVHNF